MTPQEHEILKLKMKNLAQQFLLDILANSWRVQLHIDEPSLRVARLSGLLSTLQRAEKEYSDLTLSWLDPAQSDMQSGIFQEAFDESSKLVVKKLTTEFTAAEQAKFLAGMRAIFSPDSK